MILDSVKNLNAIHAKLVHFVASPKEIINIEAVTYGNPEPYSEFLPYIEFAKSHGEVKVLFGENHGLIISGTPANLAKYIEAFQFDKDEDGNHHHPDFSLMNKGNASTNGLWPFVEADNDYVAEHK